MSTVMLPTRPVMQLTACSTVQESQALRAATRGEVAGSNTAKATQISHSLLFPRWRRCLSSIFPCPTHFLVRQTDLVVVAHRHEGQRQIGWKSNASPARNFVLEPIHAATHKTCCKASERSFATAAAYSKHTLYGGGLMQSTQATIRMHWLPSKERGSDPGAGERSNDTHILYIVTLMQLQLFRYSTEYGT